MTTAPATKRSFFNRPTKPSVNPYLAGAILGVILFLSFFFTGNGLGSSGATTRIDAALVDAVAPQHVDNYPLFIEDGRRQQEPAG